MPAELAATEPPAIAIAQQQSSSSDLIQWAKQNGATVAEMKEFYQFQREIEADQARKAFHVAFAAFKAEAIVVLRNVEIKDGPLKGKRHADLYGAVSVTVPYLSKHGLSHRWKLTRDEPAWLEVTCVITHVLGHYEEFAMGGAPDTGPGRDGIKARGSSITYLERYSFMGVCGIAAKGQDDDGAQNPNKPRLSDEDFETRISLICEAQTVSDLQKVYIPANKAALAIDDKDSARAFTNAKNKRYRELVPVEAGQ